MRTEANGVVTHRMRYQRKVAGLVAVLGGSTVIGQILEPGAAGKVVALLFSGPIVGTIVWAWWRPRVVLHDSYVRVVQPLKDVRIPYAELHPPEFTGSFTTGWLTVTSLLELVGSDHRVVLATFPLGPRPPKWQIELQTDLRNRLRQPGIPKR